MHGFDEKAGGWDNDPKKIMRAERVAEAIRETVPLKPGFRVLEYGCGTGLLGFSLLPYVGHLVLADSSVGMLEIVDEKIAAAGSDRARSLRLDLCHDPVPQQRYDLVCSLMTLHHVGDYQRLLEKFFRLLDPGGYLCIADLDSEDGSFHGEGFTGHQGFERSHLEKAVLDPGFNNVRFRTVFEIERGQEDSRRIYPVFLLTAQKN